MNELMQRRAALIAEARAILDDAEAADRDVTSEEREKFDRLMAKADELQKQVEDRQRLERARAWEAESRGRATDEPELRANVGELTGPEQRIAQARATDEYRDAFLAVCRRGAANLQPEQRAALQVGTDAEGGYLTPTDLDARLVAALEQFNPMRRLSTVISVMHDRNIPVESTEGTATWTAEEAAYTEAEPVYAQVALSAYKLGRIQKVSEELASDSIFDLFAHLADNFGRSFGVAEESAFVAGDGSGKPTGAVEGAGTGVTLATLSTITSDELIDLYHALPRAYRGRATWMFNDATIKLIRKLKDGNSQYLWQPGMQAGEPDRLLGRPVEASTGMATVAANAKIGLFGDFSYYWIADRVGGRVVQVLRELYAANGQIGYRMYERTDGKVVLSDAIRVLVDAAV